MYVCMYVCIWRAHACTYEHMLCMLSDACTCVCMYAGMHACMHARTTTAVYIYMIQRPYVYDANITWTSMCVRTHVRTYVGTCKTDYTDRGMHVSMHPCKRHSVVGFQCICTCVYVCIYSSRNVTSSHLLCVLFVNARVYASTCTCIHTHADTCTQDLDQFCFCMYTRIRTHTRYVCVYIHTYIHM
jgi:hypothetical protein